MKRRIDPSDLMSVEAYAAIRKDRRAEMIAYKKDRRLPLGPNATLYFENYDTMLYQVQEMVHTERGGEEQIVDELAAYNPLIPQGRELVATFMLEYEDPAARDRVLRTLGGIEETVYLDIEGARAQASWETDVDRTTPEGKTSSIHFLRFPMTEAQAKAFKTPGARIVAGVEHAHYGHMAVVPEAVRKALAGDLE